MKIEKDDVWTLACIYNNPIICITTNGYITSRGFGIMGRGIALEAKLRYPSIERILGDLLKKNGNIVQELVDNIIAFPVKHNWNEKASIKLIKQSTASLNLLARANPKNIYLLPAPGTGNGCLKWSQIKDIVSVLPDNVIIVSKEDIFND